MIRCFVFVFNVATPLGASTLYLRTRYMRVRSGRPLVIDQCKLEMLEVRVSTLRALHRIDMLVPFVLSNIAVRVVAQGLS